MKCNVKGHLPDREVFGAVLPTFRGTNRKGKYRQAEETRRKLEERRKLMELIHANFEERDLVQIKRQFERSGKGERLIHSTIPADVVQISICRRFIQHTEKVDETVFD